MKLDRFPNELHRFATAFTHGDAPGKVGHVRAKRRFSLLDNDYVFHCFTLMTSSTLPASRYFRACRQVRRLHGSACPSATIAPEMALTPKQRQYLKGLAPSLEPVVRVGQKGLSDAVVSEMKKSLAAHELIKVRIDAEDATLRKELAEKLAAATDAQLAATIGKTAIIYRPRDEKPRIKLP
ncbi:MAG: RNA-binding protein [Acidobacteria bacterium]|nr:RNA-binding protein [Acidobacteriota bacterium]